jgi:hypothetical protein
VVVNHAHNRPSACLKDAEHAVVGEFLQADDVGLELRERRGERVVARGILQGEAVGKHLEPLWVRGAAAAAMGHAHAMPPPAQLLRSQKDINLGASKGADSFVYK